MPLRRTVMSAATVLKPVTIVSVALAVTVGLSACGKRNKMTNEQLLQSALSAATGPKADWQKARALASKAVSQTPNDANAHVILALSLEQCGQINGAIDEIRKAVSLDPKNFMAQYSGGRMLFENNRIGDCIAPLKEAYKLRPENENVIILLARSSAKLERFKEAAGYYASLAKSPVYKDKPDIYNEIGILYVQQKEYPKALAFFNEAARKAPGSHIVVLNLGILYDVYLKSPINAIKYYNKYQELTLRNPELEPVREKLKKRIDAIKAANKL